MVYQLKKEQQLHCDLRLAWEFFSSPYNLSRITPKDIGFKVLSELHRVPIYEGMFIDYEVSPLWGIPLRWQTKITRVQHQQHFVDFQQKGPYKWWSHHHEFIPNENGVLMKDTVHYELPFGVLGRIAHGLVVRKKLEAIFNYRELALEQLFNQSMLKE